MNEFETREFSLVETLRADIVDSVVLFFTPVRAVIQAFRQALAAKPSRPVRTP